MSLREIFTDPRFRFSTSIGYPNRLYGGEVDGKKIGAVVILKNANGRSEDFALNVSGLQYVLKAEEEGRIAEGYVVLARREADGSDKVISVEPTREVHERVRNIPPSGGSSGHFGALPFPTKSRFNPQSARSPWKGRALFAVLDG